MCQLWVTYGFPMGFLWVSYGFPLGFLWVSYGFPTGCLWWFPMGLLWVSYWFPMGCLWVPYGLPWVPYWFAVGFLWVSYGFPMGFKWVSYKRTLSCAGAALQASGRAVSRSSPDGCPVPCHPGILCRRVCVVAFVFIASPENRKRVCFGIPSPAGNDDDLMSVTLRLNDSATYWLYD